MRENLKELIFETMKKSIDNDFVNHIKILNKEFQEGVFYKEDLIKYSISNNKFECATYLLNNVESNLISVSKADQYFIESLKMGGKLFNNIKTNDFISKNSPLPSIIKKDFSTINLEEHNDQIRLKLNELSYNDVYIDLTYSISNSSRNVSNLEHKRGDLTHIFEQDFELISNHNKTFTFRLFMETNEATMIKNLKIDGKKVEFYNIQNIDGFKYIFFKNIPGVSLIDWNDKQRYIEDILKVKIEIEEYDESNDLYDPDFSSEDLIVIKESMISTLPQTLGISGKYLKSLVENGYTRFYFKGAKIEEWEDKVEEISKLLNTRLSLSFDKNLAVLTEKIEEVIPKLLELRDSHKNYPKLKLVREEEGVTKYYYTFLPELDLKEWKQASKKTNFRTLFNEPNKVFELDIYNKTSKDYDETFSKEQYIVLKEYESIPSKEDLSDNKLSDEHFVNNKIFMGYGKGKSKYYVDINKMSHMSVVGSTGSGKSNLMNGVISSLLSNLNNIDRLYLMDLKGTEFVKYEDVKSDKIKLFTKKAKPSMILEALLEIEAEMHLRTALCQKSRQPKLTTNPIFFIIDEFKQIENIYCETSKDHQDLEEIFKSLSRIGSLSRSSNIKLIIQTQGAKDIPEDIKKHCMSRILMKTSVESDRDIALQNPDLTLQLGINHLGFDKGRFIFEDDNDGDTITSELQFPFVDPYDNLHLSFESNYNSDLTNSFQDSLNEFIPKVREEYKQLKNVKRLLEKNESIDLEIKKEEEKNETNFDEFDLSDLENSLASSNKKEESNNNETNFDSFLESENLNKKISNDLKDLEEKFKD